MKEAELREHATCGICGNKIGAAMFPMFYTIELKCYLLDGRALERQTGLEMMLGSPALAMIMGPGEDLAKETRHKKVIVCANCAGENVSVASLIEKE